VKNFGRVYHVGSENVREPIYMIFEKQNIIIISQDDPQGLLRQKDTPHQHPGQAYHLITQEGHRSDIQIPSQPIYSFLS
jgi:hypothetical protein